MSHFRRTYNLKLFDKENNLIAEIAQSERNNFNGLRITFQINQISTDLNSTGYVQVWGLSSATAKQLVKTARLELRAGYDDREGLLHYAQVMNVSVLKQQPELIVRFLTWDYISSSRPVGLMFKATDTQLSAFQRIAELVPGLVVDPINLVGVNVNAPLGKAVSVFADHYLTAFKKVAAQLDLRFWINNAVLYTYPRLERPPPRRSPIDVSSNTGMVGSPVFNVAQGGVSVQALLDARYIPSADIKVSSIAPKLSAAGNTYVEFDQEALTRGIFTILKSTHLGDSRGQSWYSMFEAFGVIKFRVVSQ